MKTILIAAFMVSTLAAADAASVIKSADAEAVNTGCALDATTAGCANEKVGTGLLKCLDAYKKAHKDYIFSETCKTALNKIRDHRKAKK